MSTTFDTRSTARADSTAEQGPWAVEVERLSKTFRIPHRKYSTLKERALHPFSSRTYDELNAVNDISFRVHEGEFFGIVGRNGSGKSTLLKALAGIYTADRGHAIVRGRLSPFIELGVGFNPELTARDNVLINAVMLGLTRKQALERFDEIIAFGELEEFLDLKLKNYSSGMSVRLAFSVAIQVDADVLLIDEVLAVGDAAFQQKCFDEFNRLKAEGKTIVFITHDMSAVERFCDRAMLLERGRMVSLDRPDRIARAYNELNFGRRPTPEEPEPDDRELGAARIRASWFENAAGERVTTLGFAEPLTMCAEVEFGDTVENPWFGMLLRNEAGVVVFVSTSMARINDSGTFHAGQRAIARTTFDTRLTKGRYTLSASVSRPATHEVLDFLDDSADVMLTGAPEIGGVVSFAYDVSVSRV